LTAVAHDSALKKENASERININFVPVPTVTPTPTVTPAPTATLTLGEKGKDAAKTNAPSLFILLPIVIGLAIMLVLTRRQIATGVQVVTTGTTTLVKGLTQRLGGPPAPALAKLVVTGGPGKGGEYRIPMTVQIVRVGRDMRSSDFQINDGTVSSLHFSILQGSPYPGQPAIFQIQDENSANRTVLNGMQLPPQQPYPLSFGSTIQVGNSTILFQQIGGATQRLSQPTQYQP
jgi:hypothetical protein